MNHAARKRTRFPARLLLAAINLYGFGLTAFLLARLAVREAVCWPVAFANSLLGIALLPSLLLGPVALLGRRWWTVLGLAGPLTHFVLSYGALLLPRPATTATVAEDTFSLLTYNLHAEADILDPMVSIIHAANADIVNIQELSAAAAARLEAEFAAKYPYRAFHPKSEATTGQGILSRFPILEDTYWQHADIPNAQGQQRVVLAVKGRAVTLYNVHPVHPGMVGKFFDAGPRQRELDRLLAQMKREDGPALMAGDFNMSDQSDAYHSIAMHFQDSYRAVGRGLGPTFPDWSTPQGKGAVGSRYLAFLPPFLRLDYVFHNDHLRALEAHVWPTSGGSDHRPLWVRLALE